MKTIYLIRHGRPAFPEEKHMCLGRTDIPLNEEGFAQAAHTAQLLKDRSFTVYASPLIRAVQTAEAFGKPITVLEDLQELYAGDWDGLTFDTIRERYPELYAARGADKTIPLPGAEDHAAGLRRFRSAVTAAAEAAPGDLAIVAHGGVMGLFLQDVTGQWEKPGYGEIRCFTHENGKFKYIGGKENA